jgi:hypothetical protein
MHPLLVKRLNGNAKLLTQGSDLVAGINIMTNHDIIIPLNQRVPISTGIA